MKRYSLLARKCCGKSKIGDWLKIDEDDDFEKLQNQIPKGGEHRLKVVKNPIETKIPDNFAEIISRIFCETKLKKYQFERVCDLSPGMIGKLMTGKHIPTFETVLKMSRRLNIDLGRFYGK